MFLLKIKSILFKFLEKFRNKKLKLLEVTEFNEFALFPSINYFKTYEKKLFHKIVPEKIQGNVISMGSCFSEQIGFLLSKNSSKQYLIYENTETNRFFFNADWGRIYSPVSYLKLLKFYNGKEQGSITELPVSVSAIINERKFKNFISEKVQSNSIDFSFVELYREHLFISDSRNPLLQNLELHKKKAVNAISDASNLFLTFGTLEYWIDKLGNLWPIRPSKSIVKSLEVQNKTLAFDEFRDILNDCIDEIRNLNPAINIFLFVTPVPLYATFTVMSSLERFFFDSSVILLAMRSLVSEEKKVFYLPIYESILIDNPLIKHSDMRHIIDKKVRSVLENILEI